MGMSKARRVREDALRAEQDRQREERYQKNLVLLEAAVSKYDQAVERWDSGCAGGDTREKMMQASTILHEDMWYMLMEFYRRNRSR